MDDGLDSTYSFYSEDSYELCTDGPDPATLNKRPGQVPPLNLDELPAYESTSEEEEGDAEDE